jgi:hypothetical protein
MPRRLAPEAGTGLIPDARHAFHAALLTNVLFTGARDAPTNADSANQLSVNIARGLASRLKGEMTVRDRLAGQRAGHQFEEHCLEFVRSTFLQLSAFRPGIWDIKRAVDVTAFEQYSHLADLHELVKREPRFAAALQRDYLIVPDIVIAREPESDEHLNSSRLLVDHASARYTAFRTTNNPRPILHASISCKWTIRSDRVQNSRTEALNLVRNRKGHLPHVVVVTGEPLPSRLAAIAMGTGDIDCVYHFALHELFDTVRDLASSRKRGMSEALSLVSSMVDGKRLKDISDLPLDLAI